LFVGAHHDTQADSVGADDNAVGVAIMIELARMLIDVPLKRTVRLISFGAEEQLSVGSATYVRQHREELSRDGVFMLNFDACGSLLGWTKLFCYGQGEIGEYLNRFFTAQDEYIAIKNELMPYADHFPFSAVGMTAASLHRSNCTSGRFFHHRPDDTMSRIDISLLARFVNIGRECLINIARADPLPFSTSLPQELRAEIDNMWQELYGGWEGFVAQQ
jgi:Zn-dependent M28 family amino/carboxypeptidase